MWVIKAFDQSLKRLESLKKIYVYITVALYRFGQNTVLFKEMLTNSELIEEEKISLLLQFFQSIPTETLQNTPTRLNAYFTSRCLNM